MEKMEFPMKMFAALVLAAMMFTSAAHAEDDVIGPIFWSSKEVKEEFAKLQKAGYTESRGLSQIVLSGSCGVAGCSSEILVGVTVNTAGSNTSTASVLAIVSFPTQGKPTVRFISQQ